MAIFIENLPFDRDRAIQDIYHLYQSRGHDISIEKVASTVDALSEGAFILNFIVPLAENELNRFIVASSDENSAL